MNKVFSAFFIVFIAFCIACTAIIQDRNLNKHISSYVAKHISTVLNAQSSLSRIEVDLLGQQLIVSDLTCFEEDQWYWYAKECHVKVSWFFYLLTGDAYLRLHFKDMHIHSIHTDEFAIAHHIKKLIETPSTPPFILHACSFENVAISLNNTDFQASATIKGDAFFSIDNEKVSEITIADIEIIKSKLSLISSGRLSCSFSEKNFSLAGKLLSPLLKEPLLLKGEIKDKDYIVECKSSSTHANARYAWPHVDITSHINLAELLLKENELFCNVKGNLLLSARCNMEQKFLQFVEMKLSDGCISDVALPECHASIHKHFDEYTLECAIDKNRMFGSYKPKIDAGELFLTNEKSIPYKNYIIEPSQKISCLIDKNSRELAIACSGIFSHTESQKPWQYTVDGVLGTTVRIQGTCANYNLTVEGKNNTITGKLLKNNKPMVDMNLSPDKGSLLVQGTFLNECAHLIDTRWFCEGTVYSSYYKNTDRYFYNVRFDNGYIKWQPLSMMVTSIKCNGYTDSAFSKIVSNDTHISFLEGQLTIPHACIYRKGTSVGWAYAFILPKECLLHVQKDMHAYWHGYNVISYTPDQLKVQGFAVLDKTKLHANLFSSEFHRHFIPSDTGKGTMPISVFGTCVTRTPISIKTPFLDATARCHLHMNGDVTASNFIDGSIHIVHGILKFPYKPLILQQGSINITSSNLGDPQFEFFARNQIKNYLISVHAYGTLTDPHLHMDSSPYMSKDQIIKLLLGGSEDGSISVTMHDVLHESFNHLLFGSSNAATKIQRYVATFFNPLRRVRFIPKFSDQSGRGGLRGALEIEVNDNLQLMIQQNFSLSEDTKVEATYKISDDKLLRFVKDERRDVGGELEMIWRW